MYVNVMHRLVIMFGAFVAFLSFAWNMFTSGDLLYSAFTALCVLFAVSTVLLIAMQAVARVLFDHLREEKARQLAAAKQEKKNQETEAARAALEAGNM